MKRTHIMLTDRQLRDIEILAKAYDVAFAEMLRRLLDAALETAMEKERRHFSSKLPRFPEIDRRGG